MDKKTSNRNEPMDNAEGMVLGKWGTRFRTFCGILAVLTTCWVSYQGITAIVNSVNAGKGWPSEMAIFLIVCGPIAIAWQYMSVNRLLSLLFSSDAPAAVTVKDRLRAFLDPKTSDKPPDKGTGNPPQSP